ncbi:hypothetical protein DFH05DRAFT_1519165 [Lentinula detonsa]|uniref:Uncharacterized protein n=1 Tax=Lentinula detonsa TaxID=2804962 RepID=A0A9W8PC21_9AGAR|nr:hypothetical protein DFH05DRAFT_1519165 [Lentinula detonsa]
MSLLLRTTISRVSATSSVRAFHASPTASKTITEKVSEVADNMNKKLGKGLASAIDKGEQATASTQDSLANAARKTQESATAAKQKANQASAGATQAKEDFKKEVNK